MFRSDLRVSSFEFRFFFTAAFLFCEKWTPSAYTISSGDRKFSGPNNKNSDFEEFILGPEHWP